MLKLEKWMGYEGWPWVDELDRRSHICNKAHGTLHKVLWSHRYYWLTSTAVDGKSRLIISPKEGVEPLPLPEWLSTPYIVRVPYQDFTYKPETDKEICKIRPLPVAMQSWIRIKEGWYLQLSYEHNQKSPRITSLPGYVRQPDVL